MLNKLNNIYRKLIVTEAIQEDWEKIHNPNRWIKQCNTDDQFIDQYMKPLNKDGKLLITLDMQNTFRVDGFYKDVIDFLNKFKVDTNFLEDPKQFILIAPMIVINTNDFGHKNQFNEGYFPQIAFNKNYTLTGANSILQGRWTDFYENNPDYEHPIRVKKCTPQELSKHIEHKLQDIKDLENIYIALEFFINCSGMGNGRLEENSFTFGSRVDNKTISDIINKHESDTEPTVITKETRNKDIEPTHSKKARKKSQK